MPWCVDYRKIVDTCIGESMSTHVTTTGKPPDLTINIPGQFLKCFEGLHCFSQCDWRGTPVYRLINDSIGTFETNPATHSCDRIHDKADVHDDTLTSGTHNRLILYKMRRAIHLPIPTT